MKFFLIENYEEGLYFKEDIGGFPANVLAIKPYIGTNCDMSILLVRWYRDILLPEWLVIVEIQEEKKYEYMNGKVHFNLADAEKDFYRR